MGVLSAAVIIVGVLCLIDLLLTFGVIRRLRQQAALLNSHARVEPAVIGLGTGRAPAPFTVVTIDGIGMSGPAGIRLAAFFSSSCSVCPRRVGPFSEYVRSQHMGRNAVLAVVHAGSGESVPYLDELAEVAMLCVQPADGELATAFQVLGYPAFCLLDAEGAVQAVSYDPAELPGLVIA